MVSILKTDKIQASHGTEVEVSSGHELHTDTLKGTTTAGSITVQGEGSNTTNLQQGLCKCWAKVSADGASNLDSFNVSTIDDDGTGDGGIHFTTDMANANYSIQLTVDHGGAGSSVNSVEVTDGTQAAGSFDYTNNYVNSVENRVAFNVDRYIAVFGDLA